MVGTPIPTEAELDSISKAVNKLWDLDENRLECDVHYRINLQGHKKVYQKDTDAAPESLFEFVDKDHFFSKGTYATFYKLLDNYEKTTGKAEVVTDEEIHENRQFIDQIMLTKPIKYLRKYLVAKGLAPKENVAFKKFLYGIWFTLYRRGTRNDSCGFEHVFVGELKNGKVIGFHNWIQLFVEERKGNLDYQGYICPRRRRDRHDHSHYEPNGDERIISLNFKWGSESKDVSSTFIGVSPEFEVALYTLCFLCGGEDNKIYLDDYDINIKCYHQGKHLGTCFPELLSMHEQH